MPHEIRHEIKARDIRKGDRFVDGHEVIRVKVGRTRVSVDQTGHPVTRYFPLESDLLVTVVRTETTPEEKTAQRVEFALEDIAQKIARMHKSSPAADLAAKLVEDACKGYRSPAFEVLKWHAEKTVKAETERELWLAIEVVQANRESTLAEAFVIWYEETLRAAAFGYPGDTYSGRVTNDLIRLQNETRVVWLRDNEYTYNALAGRTITMAVQ